MLMLHVTYYNVQYYDMGGFEINRAAARKVKSKEMFAIFEYLMHIIIVEKATKIVIQYESCCS